MSLVKSILLLSEDPPPLFQFDADEILNCIMDNTTDCIAVKDIQGRYVWINNAGATFLNRTIEEVIGKTDFDLFDLEAALKIRNSDKEVMSEISGKTHEAFLKPVSAAGRQFKAVKRAFKNSAGEVQGIINIVQDISSFRLQVQ